MEKFFGAIKKYFREMDRLLFLLSCLCTIYGLLLVYSATLSFGTHRYVIIQAAGALIGLVGMVLLSKIDYDWFSDIWWILLILSVGAIGVTLVFGHGPSSDPSNRNWLSLGFVDIQPSEFVKLGFILVFASFLNKNHETLNTLKGLLKAGVLLLFFFGLIVLQGDLGSALVFLFIALVMLFVAGLYLRFFALGALLILIASPLVWEYGLSGYMKKRILFGFTPELDPQNYGFQAIQSKIAIGSGQLTGKGFTHGTLVQYELLPAKQTDFIFGVAGEEFGFLGASLLIVLLALFLVRTLIIARRSKDMLGNLIAMGVFGMFFAQIFENLGMAMGFLPVVGITLPFFSYGGSSIVSSWWALGLLQSVYIHRRANLFSPLD